MAEAKIVLSAEDKTAAAFASAKRNMADLSASASRFVANFAMVGTAVGAAVAAVGAGAAVKTLDTLDDLSEKTGIAVESLSALRYAGEVVGTPMEALATSTRVLAKNMAEAAGGNKELARTFAAVGVAVKNSDGSLRSQDAVLLDLADKFRGYEDSTEKAALAQKIFGKAGQEMIPLLNQGGDSIRKLREEAEALGAVYGGELARQAAEFNDNLKRMQLAGEAAGAAIAGRLLPTLNDLAAAFIESKKGGSSLADALGTGLLTVLQTVIVLGSDVAFVFKGISREIGAAAAQAAAFARGDFRSGLGIGDALQKDNEAARRQLDDFQRRIMGLGQRSGDVEMWGAEARAGRNAAAARGRAPIVRDDRDAKEAGDKARQNDFKVVEMRNRLVEESAKAAAKAEEEIAKARVAAGASAAKYIESLAAQNAAQLTSNQSLAKEIEEMGLSAEALERLRLSRLDANIAREQEVLLQAKNIEGNEAEVYQIERRIELLQKERDLTVSKSVKRVQVETKQFGDQAREDIYQATSAGLAQALREGRNPIKGFADALGNAVLDKVSRSLADALLDPILGKNGIFSVGISSFFSAMKFADGGIMTSAGAVPLRKYAAGGIASSPQLALYGEGSRPEAYVPLPDGRRIPVAMQGGAGGGDSITIIQNFTVGDVATQTTVQQAVAGSERRMVEAIERRQKYGGGR